MKKSWYFRGIEITLRELLASITIIAVMVMLGFSISGTIEEYQMDKDAEYYEAAQISDSDIFRYGMKTNVGNAFVYGNLEAVDTVTYPEIGGEYLYVKRVEEHYNMHTRTVTRTVNGKTQTHTETYWSWDYAGSEEVHSQKIRFCGVEMDYSKIKRPGTAYIDTIRQSSRVRFVYYGCRPEYAGTLYADLRDGTIKEQSSFYENQNIDQTLDQLTAGYGTVIFWVVWFIIIGFAVYGFFWLENDWLND